MDKKITKNSFLDLSILIPYLILSAVGLLMVFSATVPYQINRGLSPYRLAISQGVFIIISFVALIIIYRVKLRIIKNEKILKIIFLIIILLMIYSRVGPNTSANGAHGWIPLSGIGTIQPVEFAKLFTVWFLASIFSNRQEEIEKNDIQAIFKGNNLIKKVVGGWRFPIILLMIVELSMPNLGNTAIIGLLAFIMIGASGISWRWFSGYGKMLLTISLSFLLFLFISGGDLIPGSYINARFKAFVNPFTDLASSGHQLANSYYAIVDGGWFGRGLGNSIEKQGFLPEAHTDFIFSVIVEELGIIGGIIILAVIFFMITRMLLVGMRAKDPFNSMISIGCSSFLLIQVFVNLGGAIGLVPETGVTFPFLSQGGSSFLISTLAVGLVLNSSADEKLKSLSKL